MTTTSASAAVSAAPASRPYAAVVTLADGRQLMAGGCNPSHCPSLSTETDIYNPATGRWTVTTPMLAPNAAAGAALLSDGRVIVVAGCSTRLCGALTSAVEIFDPATSTWTYAASYPSPSRFLQAVRLRDGRVLAAGGQGGAQLAAVYDATQDRWTTTGSMSADRAHFTLTLLGSGDVLAAGGCGGYYCQTIFASSETYHPATGAWKNAGSMHSARQDQVATLQSSGKVLVTGGSNPPGQPVTTRELYDPAARTWSLA